VDGGSQLNLLSAMVAKEQNLQVDPLPSLLAEGVNGGSIPVYGTTTVTILITDSRGKQEAQEVPFVVTDLRRYPVYLGLPWIDAYQPRLNYATRRMLFRGNKVSERGRFQKVAAESAAEFDRTMRDPRTEVYACSVSFVAQNGAERVETTSLPPEYSDFADVASEDDSKELAAHSRNDLAINVAEGEVPPYQPLYGLSEAELVVLRKYLAEFMQRGWIRRSKSPAGAPILFAKKKDGSLRLCVDYRGLNKVTVKNRHPLPLIAESLERLAQAKIYTKLDIRDAYHRIRIKEGDEWKTAFRTRYGHFEYMVMPFGLTNAPAQFQAYMNEALAGLVDVTCIVYLDDILIFSNSKEEHTEHVREVLDRLRKAKLYVKLSKCEWNTDRTEYLGYVVTPEGVSINPERVKTIQDWPLLTSVRDIRVFVGFMNYYRRFIEGFSRIVLPLTSLTKKEPGQARGGPAMRREESVTLKLSEEAKRAFQNLKDSFLKIPILAHFEREKETRLEVDASGGAISGILSQNSPELDGKAQWRPVDFFSRKLIQAEYNYDTHDQELLAIVSSVKHWRHYLQGIHFDILTDHMNLKWFMDTKSLNHRQVRSYLVLSQYDFTLTHRPGITNPADGPSRRPDYMAEAKKPSQKNNEVFVSAMRDLLSGKRELSAQIGAVITRKMRLEKLPRKQRRALQDFGRAEERAWKEPQPAEDDSEMESDEESDNEDLEPGTSHNDTEWPNPAEDGFIWLTTAEQKSKALQECHDSPLAGHFGARRTLEKVQRRYKWKGMAEDVSQYCRDCLPCRKSTPARHRPYGPLAPLPPPTYPWEEVTMDFITELPPSKINGVVYDAILVVVCRLTKMAHYIPARGDWDGVDLAQAWIREIIRLHGIPKRVISDRGPLMKAKYWDTFQHYLSARRVLSSAFHPQTDGQTERQNQTLEQYLRCYCSLEQDDWALWIAIGEFAYNDSVHATTKTTPFLANHGVAPRGAEWPIIPLNEGEAPPGRQIAAKVIELQKNCKENILQANRYQEEYQNKKRLPIPFKVGDQVLVSTRNMKSTRPKRKLDWKYAGPGRIIAQYGPSAFKVDLPGLQNIHPVFHASLLEPYRPDNQIPHPEIQIAETLTSLGDDIWEVEKIIERKKDNSGRWLYHVKWTGYPENENSWEPGVNISHNALKEFWTREGSIPRRQISKQTPKRRPGRPPKKRGDKQDPGQ
jgi:hypothetical protein